MFNTNSPKEKVILENRIVENMSNIIKESENNQEVDNVVYTTFVQKFNEKYNDVLLSEQKELLTRYISSFTDNSLELKLYLNEEIGRLKSKLEESENTQEEHDSAIIDKTKQVIGLLEGYSTETDAQKVIMTVLKTQQLVKELYDNGSES
jgi:arginyl-tRNA synthetase